MIAAARLRLQIKTTTTTTTQKTSWFELEVAKWQDAPLDSSEYSKKYRHKRNMTLGEGCHMKTLLIEYIR